MVSFKGEFFPSAPPPTILGALLGGLAASLAALLLGLTLCLRSIWLALSLPCALLGCNGSFSGLNEATEASSDTSLLRTWACTSTIEDFGSVGANVEVLHWAPQLAARRGAVASTSNGRERVFIFFPGNPGSPHFYAHQLSRVATSLADAGVRAHIYCVGHVGHSVAVATPVRYGLSAQVAAGCAAALALRARHGGAAGCSLALGGHSVGAYIALRSAASLRKPVRNSGGSDNAPLWALLLFFPTLAHIAATPNGARLTPAFRHFRTAAWLATAALAAAPPLLSAAAVRALIPAAAQEKNAHTRAAAATLVHADVAAAALHMALDEMKDIRDMASSDAAALDDAGSTALLYFGAADGWVPASFPDRFAAHFPAACVQRCSEGHPHAYPLHEHSSARMADISTSWLLSTASPSHSAGATASQAVVSRRHRTNSSSSSSSARGGRASRSRSRASPDKPDRPDHGLSGFKRRVAARI